MVKLGVKNIESINKEGQVYRQKRKRTNLNHMKISRVLSQIRRQNHVTPIY